MPVIPKKIYIRHFGTIRETELVLPGAGLCLVVGHNATSRGVESIGAGKSLLGEAISRTLLGIKGRFDGSGLGSYSSDLCGNKNTLIQLDCDLNGTPLTIWSGYKCAELSKSGEGLRFKLGDDAPVERGTIRETRDELDRIIGVNQVLAEYAIHLDGDRLKFNNLSERQLVDLFLSSLSTPNWDGAQKSVNAALSKSTTEQTGLLSKKELYDSGIKRCESSLASYAAKLDSAKVRLDDARREQDLRVKSAEDVLHGHNERLSGIKARKSSIKVELKAVEGEIAVEYAKLELELKRTKSLYSEASAAVEDAARSVSSSKTTLESTRDRLRSMAEPDTCPTCGKPWDKKHAASALDSLKESLETTKRELLLREKSLVHEKEKRSKIEDYQDEIQDKLSGLKSASDTRKLSKEYEKLEAEEIGLFDDIDSASARVAKLKLPISDAEIVELTASIKAERQAKRRAEDELAAVNNGLVEVGAFIHVLSYLYKAFGPSGVPNLLLQDCLEYLNRAASHLSSSLTGDLVEISFSATKTLASSSEKPCLTVNVKNRTGSKKFSGSSKGEAGISNLIISETLYNLGRLWQKVAYRWLDEAVNSQDKTVRGTTYAYYRAQAKLRNQLLFVVDHSPDVEANADSVILAEKCGSGFTTYRVLCSRVA